MLSWQSLDKMGSNSCVNWSIVIFVVIIFGGSIYIPKRYGFIVNITFNRDKKAFPYRGVVFNIDDSSIQIGIYIGNKTTMGATSFALSKTPVTVELK